MCRPRGQKSRNWKTLQDLSADIVGPQLDLT